jgi:hypothetical protein
MSTNDEEVKPLPSTFSSLLVSEGNSEEPSPAKAVTILAAIGMETVAPAGADAGLAGAGAPAEGFSITPALIVPK